MSWQLPVTRILVVSLEHTAWRRGERWDFQDIAIPGQFCNITAIIDAQGDAKMQNANKDYFIMHSKAISYTTFSLI